MYKLTNPSEIKQLMNKYGKTFKKALGQNFLINEKVIDNIVAGSNITQNDMVLEIGPGIGVLTFKLAQTGARVVAVEIDSLLMPVLEETLAEFDNVEIINADFMSIGMDKLINEKFDEKKVKVAANLPYYVTTPIIMKLLEYKDFVESITVMVQKEVAKRLVAQHNTSDYGAISIAVQYRTKAEIIDMVPAADFMPMPKVDSAVVRLTVLDKPPVKVSDEKLFFKIVKGGFALRRKTLQNSLSGSVSGISKEQVAEALEYVGLSPTIRGEALSLQNYADITDYFVKNI
ncbi:MAG: 16S rRNA (adenine(1518)-N(6)/adenine(1519)-N(6))-dimethyltransferase RsmA [Bacillota bacterium]|nr:16S rRNA (adenine(1518)-N(6)/adenine(1519)-N(6))-dimethyltransferase RsmA [Bacillota bacterium]